MPKGFRSPSPNTGGMRVPSKNAGAKPKAKGSASAGDKDRMGKSQAIPTGQTQVNKFPPSTGKHSRAGEKTGKP